MTDRRRDLRIRSGVCTLAAVLLLRSAWGQEPSAGVNFSFDQVDVRSFVQLVGGETGRKFVVADNVTGKITVVSPRLRREEVYPLAVAILESAGCSVVEDGGLVRVVSLIPRGLPLTSVVGSDETAKADGLLTKVFHLKYVSASSLRGVFEPRVGGGAAGGVVVIEETNHMVITDTARGIQQVERILAEIDREGASRSIEMVPLKYVSAEEISAQLSAAMAESESRGDQIRRRLPQLPNTAPYSAAPAAVIASPRANCLLLVGTGSQNEALKALVRQLDVEFPAGAGRLNAIFLKYVPAEAAAKNISALLQKSIEMEKSRGLPGSGGAIAIEPSLANNALLVNASPTDLDVVKRLIEQIDRMPEQVHITVLIMEVSESADFNFGMEMAAMEMPGERGSAVVQGSSSLNDPSDSLMNAVQQGVFPKGLTVGVAYGTRVAADGKVVSSFPGIVNIDAWKRDGNVKILSENSLVAQDNKEAGVSIVNEIPILKSTIQGGTGSARDVIQNIDRMDVGIQLKLTPHIIPGGMVQMDLNPSIEAVIDPGGSGLTPTIARRKVSTTVTVPDGKTIVIAGLTRRDTKDVVKKVPYLGSIPLLGQLFKHTIKMDEKSNILILVTPVVVTKTDTADKVMQDWQKKTNLDQNESNEKR